MKAISTVTRARCVFGAVLLFAGMASGFLSSVSAQARFHPDSIVDVPSAQIARGTFRGTTFIIRPDSSAAVFVLSYGMIRLWDVGCHTDVMTDVRFCIMTQSNDFRILLGSDGVTAVVIGTDNFPGSSVELRVEKHKVHEGKDIGFIGAAADSVLRDLSTGDSAIVRYTTWPLKAYTLRTIRLAGIAEALEYLRFVVGANGRPTATVRNPGSARPTWIPRPVHKGT